MKMKWWWVLMGLATPAFAATPPFYPLLMVGSTAAVSTASISVSIYADREILTSPSATAFVTHGPLHEWSLSVNYIGGGTPYWNVAVEVSNDDATWTPILSHQKNANWNGTLAWAPHRKARRARLTIKSISGAGTVTATAYAEPGGCP